MSMDTPRMPPRFVPTLTEVVDDVAVAAMMDTTAVPAAPVAQPLAPVPLPSAAGAQAFEEALTQRVLERVAQSLEPLLADTISAVARQHSEALRQHLAETIEDVVSGLVAEAVQAELASRRAS